VDDIYSMTQMASIAKLLEHLHTKEEVREDSTMQAELHRYCHSCPSIIDTSEFTLGMDQILSITPDYV